MTIDVHEERQQQAEELSDDELGPPHGFCEQRIDAAAIDLLRDQVDADEDGEEQPEDRRGRQPEVLDDLDVLSGGELADEDGRADEQDREQHQVVEDAVADRFAKHRGRDAPNGAHARSPPVRLRQRRQRAG